MNSSHVVSGYSDIELSHINWKYYNKIKKKAMEQEFSWSGLVLSLSIAFFIVIIASLFLSSFYKVFLSNQSAFGTIENQSIFFESVLNTEADVSWYFNRYL